MEKKGFTLLEVLVTLGIFVIVLGIIGVLTDFTTKSFIGVKQEMAEASNTGMRLFDMVTQRVMRSKDTTILSNGVEVSSGAKGNEIRIAIETDTGKRETARFVYNKDTKEVVYYAATDAPAQVVATNVNNLEFNHSYQMERQWYDGWPQSDGIGTPVYIYAAKGPELVNVEAQVGTETIETSAVPRLASAMTEKMEGTSPLITGILLEVKKVNGRDYAVVAGDKLGIHTPGGLQSVQGKKFYVDVPLNAAYDLQQNIGKMVALMGDICADDVEGFMTMKMNKFYGGGVILSEKDIQAAVSRIEAGQEAWYAQQSGELAPRFERAQIAGININHWEALWRFLQATVKEWQAESQRPSFTATAHAESISVSAPTAPSNAAGIAAR
jgi:prepilin-type N-terminal cleavage/methylation domain-containing protein